MTRIAVSVPPFDPFDPAPFAGLGFDLTPFPADGAGGRALEAAVRAGHFAGVLDLCLAELAAELAGGPLTAGPDRLTAAGLHGVPQVVAPGGLNGVMFPRGHDVSPSYSDRVRVVTESGMTLVRTTPAECDRAALDLAQKACAARGPTAVLVPTRGLSRHAALAGPGDAVIVQALRNWVYGVGLVELDLAAGDPAFVRAAAGRLAGMLGR